VRSLGPEETALWARVASTIRPLSREKNSEQPVVEPEKKAVAIPVRAAPLVAPPTRPPPGPGVTLDGTWDRRLRSGSVQPDRVIDLHGMTLDGAWRAIDRALGDAISNGDRVLLLITGHQRSGEAPVRRGAIRAAVHDWLAASRHAGEIAAVRGAHPRHGGGGSLYIVIRRKTSAR
jgi:DNA-nicking Smr family endonuclease